MPTAPAAGRTGGRSRHPPGGRLPWLATALLLWCQGIRCVAIDMSTGYRAAVRTGLSHATGVVDHFHVVQRATTMLNIVRRRTTATLRGLRGGATDPEWKARRRLSGHR
ncbi:transposase [Streptomyces chartreusis]|uniref:transposase n=1 Tax=Streptomyces chartreusis TaxID=1969 RepID=UPI00380D599C